MSDDGDADRRIARAVTVSPRVEDGPAGGGRARSSRQRIVLVAATVCAGALLVLAATRLKGRREAAELDTSHYLTPLRGAADPATGEVTAPFSGFAVSIESEPPGAIVAVAGVPRGEAPVLAGIDCAPGKRIEIRAEKAGFATARRATTCRADTLVKLTVRLGR